jgi:hypothetical protein
MRRLSDCAQRAGKLAHVSPHASATTDGEIALRIHDLLQIIVGVGAALSFRVAHP